MVLYSIALIIHAIICIALVLVILAQTSKGGLDANLGGAAVNVFGGSGASKMLKKWTQILAVVFAISCILLAFIVRDMRGKSYGGVQERQSKIDDSEEAAAAAPSVPVPVEEPASGPIEVHIGD